MREQNRDCPPEDDSRLVLVAVRPSARFHRLGGIGSLMVLYPGRDPQVLVPTPPPERGTTPEGVPADAA
ncbi:hypothetical protein GPA27_17855 [Aromatoleum toluolicum]|uniref:Uncharacterized protein n=1 Tax=Aromatoleum toluolicum TaxID=90060 RepID=A0ABX1NIV3_9RHOO|nr:hypothetical protein [Aromatoleum toluolicum]NMF99247.1 hypothetical protein [Aromatoleum toluolicum]